MLLSKQCFLMATLAAVSYGQEGLPATINVPEKSVPMVNQTLTGTWLLELRRPGTPASQPGIPLFVVYHPDGTVTGAAADGTQSAHSGIWIRTGDRKFLQTMFLFTFNESRALASITKVRINVLLNEDGRSVRGTTEVVVLDREGKVMATVPGTTHSGIRLSPEVPADFESFVSGQQ